MIRLAAGNSIESVTTNFLIGDFQSVRWGPDRTGCVQLATSVAPASTSAVHLKHVPAVSIISSIMMARLP